MSDLKFKMLNGSDPQGRQKIYFCCHPDDFDACFPLVCGDIFSKDENCAIFYEADPREAITGRICCSSSARCSSSSWRSRESC